MRALLLGRRLPADGVHAERAGLRRRRRGWCRPCRWCRCPAARPAACSGGRRRTGPAARRARSASAATAALSVALSPRENGLAAGSKRRRSKPRRALAPAGPARRLRRRTGSRRGARCLSSSGPRCLRELRARAPRRRRRQLTYTSIECSAGPASPRRQAVHVGAARAGSYSRRIAPPGAAAMTRAHRVSRRPAVRCDAGRARCRAIRPGAEPVSAADTGPCARSSRPSSRRSPQDDAQRAFSYAAPSIREMFGNAGALHGDGARRLSGRLPAGARRSSCVPLWVRGRSWSRASISPMPAARSGSPSTGSSASATSRWRISGCDVQPAPAR